MTGLQRGAWAIGLLLAATFGAAPLQGQPATGTATDTDKATETASEPTSEPTSERAATPPSVDTCLASARAGATRGYPAHRSAAQARRQLEIAAARCFDPTLTLAAAALIGGVNADYATMAHEFVTGTKTLAAYRAVRDDRQRKLTAMLADTARQQELARGDADGDLVPDARDRCPATPALQVTDDAGCPIAVRPSRASQAEERGLRARLAGTRQLYNPSCADAPALRLPMPIQWGRGRQTLLGTQGFNLAVAKVDGQPAGCEVFYEIQLRFLDPNPGNPALPKTRYLTLVFSERENLVNEPLRAVFGLPVNTAPLSPARDQAREAFLRQYARASWRVRAINGSNQVSGWSPFVTQGPAGGGVDG